jgi:hypothetical protein
MFESFSRSWALFKVSWGVLKKDKEIMLFPVISGVATLLLWSSFLVPVVLFSLLGGISNAVYDWIFWVMLFVFYIVSYFIAIYFNAAIIGCATIRLNGGDPTVKDGLRVASSRIGKLFGWAVIAAIVGIILHAIENAARKNIIARIVISFIEMAWSFAVMFVVPVILYENTGGFGAIKRSASIIKQTLGETLISQFTLSIVAFLFSLLGIVLIGAGVYLLITYSLIVGIILIIAAIAYFLFVSILFSALNGIMVAALYRYAKTGKIGMGYEEVISTGGVTIKPSVA